MWKLHLVRIVSEHMVDNDIFEESTLDNLETGATGLSQTQLELEKAKVEVRIRQARIAAEVFYTLFL